MKDILRPAEFEAGYNQEYIRSLEEAGCKVMTAIMSRPDSPMDSFVAFVAPITEYARMLQATNRERVEAWHIDRAMSDPDGFFCRPVPPTLHELPLDAIRDDPRFVVSSSASDALLQSSEIAHRIELERLALQSKFSTQLEI